MTNEDDYTPTPMSNAETKFWNIVALCVAGGMAVSLFLAVIYAATQLALA